MTKTDAFFQSQKPAAVLKHALLHRYLTPYVTMLGSFSQHIWLVDAYAGPGTYDADETGKGTPGSPKIICDLATAQAERGLHVHGTFIERDPIHVQRLRSLVSQADPAHERHTVIEGDAQEHLEAVSNRAGSDPLLLFLDPFGTGLSFATLTAAVRARPAGASTEILLNFNLEAVWRIGGLLNHEGRSLADEKTLTRVDGFLGGTWWREHFVTVRDEHAASAAAAARSVASQFRARVYNEIGLRSLAVPIRRRPNHEPLFLLTLFYTHPAAPATFIEAASGANQEWRAYNRQRDLEAELERIGEGRLFPSEWDQELSDSELERVETELESEWVAQIVENIRRHAQERSELPLADTLPLIYGETLALARTKHLRQAWDQLATEGVVQPRTTRGRLWKLVIRR
ncbi:three-Cys-motif partner protein TcmP [Microbacterium sp. Leaf320]|uniref:three-Cys-motif partner protein TcmP n=1 Tax=Microbacterium sp. Leaf320 TaxID=1736334 RepID=UPI000B163BC1|nr:three-Cys-motif partner protein TcmP [Microbacterium sp. Leaf320]